jgi:hypothetical protein
VLSLPPAALRELHAVAEAVRCRPRGDGRRALTGGAQGQPLGPFGAERLGSEVVLRLCRARVDIEL